MSILDQLGNVADQLIGGDEEHEYLNVGSERMTIDLDVDDLLDVAGSYYVLKDIFEQIGSLPVLYKELIHKVVSECYNNSIEDTSRLANYTRDDELANMIYDSFESKLWLLIERNRNNANVTVSMDAILKTLIAMFGVVITHITSIVDSEKRDIKSDVLPTSINIMQEAQVISIPAKNPKILQVSFDFYWVHGV